MKTDVLIVGAGPVGLTLAAECHRDGVSFRLVDQAPGPSTHSKALAIWSRTIECLSAIGVAESFLEAARPIRKMVFADGGQKIAEVPPAEGLDTLWPTPLILPQSETERLLLAFLEKQGVSVARNAECVEVQTTIGGVTCKLKHAYGATETIEAGWLAGCDGARSFVRHTLPVSFAGVTEEISFILADAKADGQLHSDSILASAGAGGIVLIFPVARDIWRIFAFRENLSDRSQPTLEEIQRHLDGSGLERIRLFDPIWLSHFAVNERVVSRNRVGRVFLLGDAAHIHSPAGGQGMNTGMQDAFNLGWKLKLLVENLGDAEAIAESYFAERHSVAEKVVRNTSRLLHFGIKNNAALRMIKRGILPLLSRVEAVKKRLAYELSEIGIVYSRSPLIQQDSAAFRHQHDLAPGCRGTSCRNYQERFASLFVVRASSSWPYSAGVPRLIAVSKCEGGDGSQSDRTPWSIADPFHSADA